MQKKNKPVHRSVFSIHFECLVLLLDDNITYAMGSMADFDDIKYRKNGFRVSLMDDTFKVVYKYSRTLKSALRRQKKALETYKHSSVQRWVGLWVDL